MSASDVVYSRLFCTCRTV